MEAEFTKLAMAATEFLAKGGFFYSWEMVRQHIVNGYFVYQKIKTDGKVDDKQSVCDFCWYL